MVFRRAPFQFDWFILGLFLWPSSIWLLLLVFLFSLAFHKAPLILNASSFFFSDTFLCSALVVLFWLAFPGVSLTFSGIVHMSQPVAVCFHTHRKQVVNRLKIPQCLSTLLFHRWSEVPSRGGVRGDSPYEKLPALRRCHLSVFSECCFLELLGRSCFIRTLLLSGFVVLFSFL